ncbi:CBS domain-containing protein [Pseudocolwellia sp. HL-MZ19]|uniref:CBS domain-containing protein n=1 Tax=unclassified Pseudocolwellia TaxID=2848178 RepID=UPI003CEE477A
MSVKAIMSRDLIILDLDDNLEKAKQIFDETNIHHILVTDNHKLVGIITDRDVFKHLSPSVGTQRETAKDLLLLHKRVHLIMARNLVTAKASISLNEAVLLFHDNHISCLPVVNSTGEPIGIISWRDIIKIVAHTYRKKIS